MDITKMGPVRFDKLDDDHYLNNKDLFAKKYFQKMRSCNIFYIKTEIRSLKAINIKPFIKGPN